LLTQKSDRSDELLVKPASSLKSKLLKKCMAGIGEIRTSIHVKSGHVSIHGDDDARAVKVLNGTNTTTTEEAAAADGESSMESSFASFDDASFQLKDDDFDDSNNQQVIRNINGDIDNDHSDSDAESSGSSTEVNNDDIEGDDDEYINDEDVDCEISLEGSLPEDHVDLDDNNKSASVLQLSFEGGLCVVESLDYNSPLAASDASSKQRSDGMHQNGIGFDDDIEALSTDDENDGKRRRNNSLSRGKRRSRSNEKSGDHVSRGQRSASTGRRSRLGRSLSSENVLGGRRPGTNRNLTASSQHVLDDRRARLGRTLSSENVLGGRRPGVSRTLSSQNVLDDRRSRLGRTSSSENLVGDRRRPGVSRTLSSDNILGARRPGVARTLSSENLLGGRRSGLDRSQSSRRFLERSISKKEVVTNAGAEAIAGALAGAESRQTRLLGRSHNSTATSSSHDNLVGRSKVAGRRHCTERIGSSEGLVQPSASSSGQQNARWSPHSSKRVIGKRADNLSLSLHDPSSTSTNTNTTRPGITRQKSARASSRRDALSRGLSSHKLTDLKW
jgi:hypothetical protein